MTTIFWWILLVFATYRAAQLIALDEGPFGVFIRLRKWIGYRARDHQKYSVLWSFATWIVCPFCVGVVIAFGLAFVMRPTSIILFVAYWLSLAGAQAFLEGFNYGTDRAE